MEHVEAAYPLEACGALVGDAARIRRAVPLPNAAGRPESAFRIDPSALAGLCGPEPDGNAEVTGFYHSHPDAPPTPSRRDRESAWRGYGRLIVSVWAGKADPSRLWRFDRGRDGPPRGPVGAGGVRRTSRPEA